MFIVWFYYRRYAVLLLVVNYVAPLAALVITYSIIGKQLWGSQAIGERTPGQEETIRSKRRVCNSFFVYTPPFPLLKYLGYLIRVRSS